MTTRTRLLAVLSLLPGLLLVGGPAMAAMPAIGQKAPDFTLRASTGKNLKLSELRGKVVMLNFWATWCGPCRQEMPQLNRLHAEYYKAGFVLLGINVDDQPAAAEAMVREFGIGFPVMFDAGKQVSRRYDVDAMPSTVLIDRDGKVQHIFRGYRDGAELRYENAIRKLIRQ